MSTLGPRGARSTDETRTYESLVSKPAPYPIRADPAQVERMTYAQFVAAHDPDRRFVYAYSTLFRIDLPSCWPQDYHAIASIKCDQGEASYFDQVVHYIAPPHADQSGVSVPDDWWPAQRADALRNYSK